MTPKEIVVSTRLTQALAEKLERLAAQTQRSQSAVIRMLIERATLQDLAVVVKK